MRIFLSCQQSLRRHAIPAYSFWEGYLKRGIEEAGHDWIETPGLDWAEGLTCAANPEALRAWQERTWREVLAFLKTEHARSRVDLFLGYLFPEQVLAYAVEEIRRQGIPCVNFFCDNVRNFSRVPDAFKNFDLNWVPEKKALGMYADAGLATIHAPMPCWVPPCERVCPEVERFPASFIGSRDVQREALFAEALRLGEVIQIRGAGWLAGSAQSSATGRARTWRSIARNQVDLIRREGGMASFRKLRELRRTRPPDEVFRDAVLPMPDEQEYRAITRESIVMIGVNRYPSLRHPFTQPDTYSRLRDLEAPMLGACYLTEWTEGIDALYDVENEIETYSSPVEMVEKIRMLKADPRKRQQMRHKAQRRALEEHSVGRSLATIASTLGIQHGL